MARSQPTRSQNRLPAGVTLGLVGLLLAAALSLPATAQGDHPPGQVLKMEEPDALLPAASLSVSALCYIDESGSGKYSLGEPVILRSNGTCSGNATRDDIRLNGPNGVQAGQRIGSGIQEGEPLSAPESTAKFHYHDEDGSGSYSHDDPVYVKMWMIHTAEVTISDVRITPVGSYVPGTSVDGEDSDLGLPLKALGTPGERVRYVDKSADGNFTGSDPLYLAADSDAETIGVGDVRLLGMDSDRPYGSRVTHGTWETIGTLTMLERSLCYTDRSETGYRSPGDTLYLSLVSSCKDNVTAHDVRLSRSTHAEAGSRVTQSDPDHDAPLTTLPNAHLAYIDHDGTGSRTRADLYLVQIDEPDADQVRPYDLLLTPTSRGAGAVLSPNDDLVGEPLVQLGKFQAAVSYMKSTGSIPGPQDALYLSPSSKTGQSLKPGDVRLVPFGDHPFGGAVGLETGEMVPELTRKIASVCTTNKIPDDYAPSEPIYLRLDGGCPDTVTPGLMRLIAAEGHDAYSVVQKDDADENTTLVAAPDNLEWKYHDANEDEVYNPGETLYLDVIDTDDNEVKRGDVRITRIGSLAAGEAVTIGHIDRGDNLTTLGKVNEHTAYVEAYGEKAAYVTRDPEATQVYAGDVRLSALPEAFVAPESDEYVEPEQPGDQPAADKDSDGSSNEDLDPGDTNEGEDEEDVPGPVLGLVLLSMVLGVMWIRRCR